VAGPVVGTVLILFMRLLKKSIIPVLCFSLIITNNIQSRTLAHSNCGKMTHAYSK